MYIPRLLNYSILSLVGILFCRSLHTCVVVSHFRKCSKANLHTSYQLDYPVNAVDCVLVHSYASSRFCFSLWSISWMDSNRLIAPESLCNAYLTYVSDFLLTSLALM